ncbi:TetR/AcrR family transcriptional regulator [Paenibacillus koleovorans]|uniref:TetR/AcrR family transcriptional regulator n=1 Tax=Paenibacillus koleovorans TaxID=121608 RepID=UPI000FDB599F|nr:TetR/AcrR family transcriptional regulator [Paenibacillus koleovorans]
MVKQADRRKQTIQLLLSSTKSLIQQKGCHAVTMKDIMDVSGLSKGAIFHYVNSKDEIFAWVLQERLEETNEQFMDEVERGERNFEGPMRRIAGRLSVLEDPQDVTNKVLMYLLGKEEDPAVAEALKQFYARSVELSKQWIVTGQQHGVIPDSINADQTAEMFVLLSFGLRIRSSLSDLPTTFGTDSFTTFLFRMLHH